MSDDKETVDAPDEAGVSLYNLGVEGETGVTHIADILCEEMNLQAELCVGRGSKKNGTGGFKRILKPQKEG